MADRQMLTNETVEKIRLDNHLGLTQAFLKSARADVKRMTRYIAALERVATVLLDQVDEVSTLSAVTKTRKGQALIQQARLAREFHGTARAAFDAAGSREEAAS